MKKRKTYDWFPFWIDKWLFGSTRIELEPDERGMFVDLMVLSNKDDGYIRANEGVPYLNRQLCGLLNVPEELLKRTLEKCIKYKKAEKLKDGTYRMTSHESYKLSSRHKLRFEEKEEDWDDTIHPTYRINDRIRSAVYDALKKKRDGGIWEKLLSYTRKDLVKHLESLFKKNMSWENYGKWHIDHKIPLLNSGYTKFSDVEEIRRFWCLENLGPLWAKENLKKSSKTTENGVMSQKGDFNTDTDKDTDTKNNTEKKKKEEEGTELKKFSSMPPSKRINYDFEKEKWRGILRKDIDRWKKAYPNIDIVGEIRRLGEWLLNNPKNKKKNYARFIGNNLSRKQDKSGFTQYDKSKSFRDQKRDKIKNWAEKKD